MGMAASQARFLGITARKSNVEYEGQQINQQRTALANQSANLYNQMLAIDVPVPPNKSDAKFTKTSYTFTDDTGATATINSLSDNPDVSSRANWPKVVKFTTTENVNKAYRSSLSNAIITSSTVNGTSNYYNKIAVGSYAAAELRQITLDAEYMKDNAVKTNIYNTIYASSSSATEATTGTSNLHKYNVAASGAEADYRYLNMTTNDDDWEEKDITDKRTASLTPILDKDGNPVLDEEGNPTYEADSVTKKGQVCDITEYDKDGKAVATRTVLREPVYGDSSDPDKITSYTYAFLEVGGEASAPTYTVDDDSQKFSDVDDSATTENECTKIDETNGGKIYGCGVTDDDKATDIDNYVQSHINNLLEAWPSLQDEDTFYTYTINNVDYYIPASMVDGEWGSNDFTLKGEPPYSYYNQTVQQDKEKVMEANPVYESSTGRLQSITLNADGDVITCSVTTNSVTDEDAYNDAMNQYTYDYNEYEKKIADINAQTEIIQSQDRELELRLKQLDTEQEALTQEMDAIKKVIDKNTETTFKTFA